MLPLSGCRLAFRGTKYPSAVFATDRDRASPSRRGLRRGRWKPFMPESTPYWSLTGLRLGARSRQHQNLPGAGSGTTGDLPTDLPATGIPDLVYLYRSLAEDEQMIHTACMKPTWNVSPVAAPGPEPNLDRPLQPMEKTFAPRSTTLAGWTRLAALLPLAFMMLALLSVRNGWGGASALAHLALAAWPLLVWLRDRPSPFHPVTLLLSAFVVYYGLAPIPLWLADPQRTFPLLVS